MQALQQTERAEESMPVDNLPEAIAAPAAEALPASGVPLSFCSYQAYL